MTTNLDHFSLSCSLGVVSRLSKSGKPFRALVADLVYTKKYLCFDVPTIAEILDVSPSTLIERTPLDSFTPIEFIVE